MECIGYKDTYNSSLYKKGVCRLIYSFTYHFNTEVIPNICIPIHYYH